MQQAKVHLDQHVHEKMHQKQEEKKLHETWYNIGPLMSDKRYRCSTTRHCWHAFEAKQNGHQQGPVCHGHTGALVHGEHGKQCIWKRMEQKVEDVFKTNHKPDWASHWPIEEWPKVRTETYMQKPIWDTPTGYLEGQHNPSPMSQCTQEDETRNRRHHRQCQHRTRDVK